jgi:hypothetical protein
VTVADLRQVGRTISSPGADGAARSLHCHVAFALAPAKQMLLRRDKMLDDKQRNNNGSRS